MPISRWIACASPTAFAPGCAPSSENKRRLLALWIGPYEAKDTFYATAHAQRGEESFTIDARPSDAIALALRTQSPIFAAPEVMEAVGLDIPVDMEVVSSEERREENHSKLLSHLTEAGCLRQSAEPADG